MLIASLPMLLKGLLLTIGMGLLLGLGLREYYLARPPVLRVGTTRTILLTSILGYALWVIAPLGYPYAVGFLVLGGWLGLFYHRKLALEGRGLLGMLFIVLGYVLGPLTLTAPAWFVVATGISALFVLNARDKIIALSERMASQEIITLAKFLVLSMVILPLTPVEPIATVLPVSWHETWLAVVVISGISYVSYLAQTYFTRGSGILLTGAIGGLYSSTAASLVIARQSHRDQKESMAYAAGIIMATGMMYFRLLILASLFDRAVGAILVFPFLLFGGVMMGIALIINHLSSVRVPSDSRLIVNSNPLELTAAAIFAGSFLFITGLTHYLLATFPSHGLRDMALLSGLTDIDPFVLAIVSGHFVKSKALLASAIAMAAGSNGIMKGIYVLMLGSRTTRWLGSGVLFLTATVTVWMAFFWPRFVESAAL